ncbi:MAG: SDR family oxidoreductase [Gammaproteobacteria bacterium]|jgi:NAD(P)-dependent dehydrogenase (short-subunit alcohol dehydrogenase family)|nr:MAG: SDR family oxidoreductase [Gammaproteobacteria bacterium]
MRLEGKVAAITGAASGFGREAARRFVAEGAKVVLGDIQEDALAAVADELGEAAIQRRCDVTREEDVAALVDAAVEGFGQLDVMYNNAGIVGAVGPISTMPADEWQLTLDIHLNGSFYGCKHAARVMMPRETGSIINMASTAGLLGGQGPHAYAVAKHGLIGLTKNVAAELCHYGIRVNCIAPAGMATAMAAGLTGDPEAIEQVKEGLAKTSPLKGRPGLASDVANAALWLASDESGYTNGLTLTTDAGLTTGSSMKPPPFNEHQPLIREAGKRGL